MTKHDFFHSTPTDVYLFMTEYDKRLKAKTEAEFKKMEYSAWTTGFYVRIAVASVLSKKAKYPKQPYGHEEQNTIVAREDMSAEEKAEITDLLFANLGEMQRKFENYKQSQQSG